ncbi:lysophospholipase [Spongiibacter taiwanensis]|uniref:alpha/beta hydrolase n=1 Tax=Spongiibacter taiwanensis TaxID=1748242 RepID=UPI0020353D19|nr:alpha/beta hydrolase [Spongiibacter taiwanensis]USA42719.1 lysophospholipase [Spongiibacter taiwanensis]
MKTETSTFTNAHGCKIFTQSWLPEADGKANVFIIHGLGEHSGRYAEIASYLAQRSFRVHALDHTGHGQSEGLRGYISQFSIFVDTVKDFILRCQAETPNLPSLIIGHSMGGVITSNLLIDHPTLVQGAVLSGPALTTDDAVSDTQKFILKTIAKILPKLPVLQLDANLVCRDKKVVDDYLADPLVNSGKIRAKLIVEILLAGERALSRAAEIKLPMLFLHGEEDGLASPKGSQLMHAAISSDDKEIVLYPDLYHEIFNEECKQEIFATVDNWLNAHC